MLQLTRWNSTRPRDHLRHGGYSVEAHAKMQLGTSPWSTCLSLQPQLLNLVTRNCCHVLHRETVFRGMARTSQACGTSEKQ